MPMAIKLTCECGRSTKLEDRFAGKKAKCPDCGTITRIPNKSNPEEEEIVVLEIDDQPPRRKKKVEPDYEVIEEEEPKPEKSQKKSRFTPEEKRQIARRKAMEGHNHQPLIALSPATVGSLGLILSGIIWLAISYSTGRRIWGIALIVVGIFGLLSALMGGEEE
jgi:hypothetical protein